MKLSEKYNVPEQTIKAMIKDGWISSSVPYYEEVVYHYKAQCAKGVKSLQAVHNVSEKLGISERHVYRIIHDFK